MLRFGELVKRHRKEAGISQRDLAEKLSVNFTYISKIENDALERPPSRQLICDMALILGGDPDEWLRASLYIDWKLLQSATSKDRDFAALMQSFQNIARIVIANA